MPIWLAFTCALSRGEIKGDSCARAVPSYGLYNALKQLAAQDLKLNEIVFCVVKLVSLVFLIEGDI